MVIHSAVWSGCTGNPESAADAEVVVKCAEDTLAFSATPDAGTTATSRGGAIQARVIHADPAMPERYNNDWVVRFMDPSGTTLEDVEIADACAFMPVHQHGGAPRDTSAMDDAGTFGLVGLNLFMRGPWEVQLAVNSEASGATSEEYTACDRKRQHPGADLVIFRVCVPDE